MLDFAKFDLRLGLDMRPAPSTRNSIKNIKTKSYKKDRTHSNEFYEAKERKFAPNWVEMLGGDRMLLLEVFDKIDRAGRLGELYAKAYAKASFAKTHPNS